MKSNPFTSSTYASIWSKHFNEGKALQSFDFIKGVKFVKNSSDGVYINAARNLTKGIYYSIDDSKDDYKGKCFLVYDVPEYFGVEDFEPKNSSKLRVKKVFQYKGFLMDISSFENQDEYINAQFSSKNRREFRSNMRRLEQCFNIRYEFINQALDRDAFDTLFEQFYALLSKRFADKQTNYHHLSTSKWNFYKDLVFEMLEAQKASFLVIYNEESPIGITLNYHSEDILFESITVFDPDYYKFSIGKTSIIKLLEWCFENNYKISDFSKGDFEYKYKWSNVVYDFNYHILYDSGSLLATLKAKYVESYFRIKLYLRKRKINELYRKLKFLLVKDNSSQNAPKTVLKFEKIDGFNKDSDQFTKIDYSLESNEFLLLYIYTFAFANPEPIEQIHVFQSNASEKEYVISGSKKSQKITFV